MKHLLMAAFLSGSTLLADCQYQSQTPKVSWKAFKTYEKLGVAGTFNTVAFKSQTSASIDALLASQTISIDTNSINSGNAGRDTTLVNTFFTVQKANSIKAKIISAKENKASVEITMNNVTKTIPMTYSVTENKIIGNGVIDLGDFGMLPSLSSINKACYDLHSGKTWQDIEIRFETAYTAECK